MKFEMRLRYYDCYGNTFGTITFCFLVIISVYSLSCTAGTFFDEGNCRIEENVVNNAHPIPEISFPTVPFPALHPITATLVSDLYNKDERIITLENSVLRATWFVRNNKLIPALFQNIITNENISLPENIFQIKFDGPRMISSSNLDIRSLSVEPMLSGGFQGYYLSSIFKII